MHKLQELVRLHRMGTGARESARLLGISPNTERKWRMAFQAVELWDGPLEELPSPEQLENAVPGKPPKQQVSKSDNVREKVAAMMKKGAEPRAIFERLRRNDDEFKGSYWSIKRLVKRIRREQGVQAEDVVIPVETDPGEVAQIDFGYVGKLFDPITGRYRRAWIFIMVLGHSRHMFAKIVFRQTSEMWQQLHVEAFEFFGGVPKVMVPDNLKAAIVRAAFSLSDDPGIQRAYRELARHYGFKIDPTPPYSPCKKGKVESSVKYAKRSFIRTLPEDCDVDEANRQLMDWLLNTAGKRIHGTTFRRPLEAFETEELPSLLSLPEHRYRPCIWKKAKVHRDSHVVFDKRLYSVPWRWLDTEVWVRATAETVTIYAENTRIADHSRRGHTTRSTFDSHLPNARVNFRHRSREWWEERAKNVGDEVAALVTEMFDDDDVLSPLRKVQAIVTHLEEFPPERANNAAKRARAFGTHDVRGVKAILRKGLDMQPLPASTRKRSKPLSSPKFQRPISEMLLSKKENSYEYH